MAKRIMPIKTKRIELDGDFEGWWAEIRTNPPVGLLLDAVIALQEAQASAPESTETLKPEAVGESPEQEEDTNSLKRMMPPMYDLLMLTVHKWNFVDEQGKDLPANLDGIKQMPFDLIMMLTVKIQEAIVSLPLVSSEPSSSRY